jgi:hypothetical protein
MTAYYNVANQDTDDGENSRSGKVFDTWNDTLDDDTLLADFTEATYMPDDPQYADAGHLPDGSDEVQASVASNVLTKTEEVGARIAVQPENRKQLELRIADAVFGQLKRVYANDPAFIAMADDRLAKLHAAANQ